MSLTPSAIKQLALLARLDISAAEADTTLGKLNDVLKLVETMQAVDTRSVEPLQHPLAIIGASYGHLRDDVATESDQREAYQKCAPATADGLYLVPRVIE